jgi:adenosylmethionine-8-amino-7-oxononanoate aminotransferase
MDVYWEQSEDLPEAGSEAGIEPLRTHDLVVDVRAGDAFMAGVQLCPDFSGEAVAEACTDAGLLIRTIHNNTLQICSPFVTTDDEISLISETITRAPRHLSRLTARALPTSGASHQVEASCASASSPPSRAHLDH